MREEGAAGRPQGEGGRAVEERTTPAHQAAPARPQQNLWVGPEGSPEGFLPLGVQVPRTGTCPGRSQPNTSVVGSVTKCSPDTKCCPRERLCGVAVRAHLALGQRGTVTGR